MDEVERKGLAGKDEAVEVLVEAGEGKRGEEVSKYEVDSCGCLRVENEVSETGRRSDGAVGSSLEVGAIEEKVGVQVRRIGGCVGLRVGRPVSLWR